MHTLILFVGIIAVVSPALALESVAGSPCAPICDAEAEGALKDDVVCLDGQYSSTSRGRNFKDCIACQLNSTAVDTTNNVTDVDWAFYNMRFTLSVCMFGYPEEKVGISSPCQVTCQPLSGAIGYALSNDTSHVTPGLGYCNHGQFDDTTINNCAFCYGFVPQQLFMANFLQTLHIACRQPPTPGQEFFPKANTIFNESVIPGPTALAASSGGSGGLHGWRLAIAIALPIVGFIVLAALACFGCYNYTKQRRRQMADSGRMNRLQQGMALANDPTFGNVDPYIQRYSDHDWTAQEMSTIRRSYSPNRHPQPSPIRDDVGPGQDQVQDHELHNQYLGQPGSGGIGEAIPMTPTVAGTRNPDEISPVSAHSHAGPSYAERVSFQQQQRAFDAYDGGHV